MRDTSRNYNELFLFSIESKSVADPGEDINTKLLPKEQKKIKVTYHKLSEEK